MKKQFTIFLIFLSTTFPALALAYPGQYPWDPLHVEVQPTQQYKNEQTKQELINQYGSTAFYSCYSCMGKDTSNPYIESSCLSSTKYCLESPAQQLIKNLQNLQQYNPQNNETPDAGCKRNYGQYSYYTGKTSSDGKYTCDCMNGYEWNANQSACIKKNVEQNNNIQNSNTQTCQANSTKIGGVCVCNEGYIMVDGNCISHTENCQKFYGGNVYGAKGNDNNSSCYCSSGYDWDSDRKNCIKQTSIIEEEKKLITKIDNSLSKRVSGNILLQVEKSGEGWYVNPDDKKKYYLGRPADAFSIMRNLGLGIKHNELAGYINKKFPSRLSGKIMLDVEQNGEAYYINPKNLKGYFLNRPADAFSIMRELGLG
ncbi:hypothetical protein L6249_00565, partial [Candidatus Parcubacteria bacterium]|nr:hypothetical protein [Candidatus Parcubacteria bacterium]